MQDTNHSKIEIHHIVFAVATIITAFLISLWLPLAGFNKSSFWDFIAYIVMLIFFVKVMCLAIHGIITVGILELHKHCNRNPISMDNLDLTSSAIIVGFLINDIYGMVGSVIIAIISSILLLIFVFWLYKKIPFYR